MTVMDLEESMKLLRKYKIPLAKSRFAGSEREVSQAATAVGFPLVMKLVSSKITHKTDAGGIILNIQNLQEAKNAYKKLGKLRGFKGAMLQEMVKGREIIIGGKRDIQFGPTVLFGLGGVFVEVMKDFSLRICPISLKDADEMIREIKGYKLLQSFRGEKAVNFPELKKTLHKANKLMMHENVKELDINPLIANEKRVVAVDARVVI